MKNPDAIFTRAKEESLDRIRNLYFKHKDLSQVSSFSSDFLHRDLLLVSEQTEIFRPLVEIADDAQDLAKDTELGNDQRAPDPLVRVAGCHYFTYDHTRVTKIVSEGNWLKKRLLEFAGFDREDVDLDFLGQLIMFAYRQVFDEAKTFNAWVLRDDDSNYDRDQNGLREFCLHISDEETECGFAATLSNKLASRLMPHELCEEVIVAVCQSLTSKASLPNGASARFEVAAAVYRRVNEWKDKRSKALESSRLTFTLDDPECHRAYKQASDQLKLPSLVFSWDKHNKDLIGDVASMLQSAVFYLTVYDAVGFYTFEANRAHAEQIKESYRLCSNPPYGLTALTRRHLSEKELCSLDDYFQQISTEKDQFLEAAAQQIETQHRYELMPEELLEERLETTLKGVEGESRNRIWQDLIRNMHLPAIALYILIRCMEEACAIEVEHEYPKTAFVLSQRSYLSSIGFVAISSSNNYGEPSRSYRELVAPGNSDKDRRDNDRLLREVSALYELTRWESGRGLLPYDLVESQDVVPDTPMNDDLSTLAGKMPTLKSYLVSKFGDPVPASGFHLIDLDGRFVYPAIGIHAIQRGRTGYIGRFRPGSPPAGATGLEPYRVLSERIPRFVAAVTDGKGGGVLVAKGRVQATYNSRGWAFYDRQSAQEKLSQLLSTKRYRIDGAETESMGFNLSSELATSLLEVAEEMAQIHRKGAAFVLVDFTADSASREKVGQKLRRYFVRMVDGAESMPNLTIDLRNVQQVVSYAQVDGCCTISSDGQLLSYGLKMCVSPEKAFLEAADAESLESSKLSSDERKDLEKQIRKGERRLRRTLEQPGTRRWSSAMLSLATGWPVLIVSADGPVTCFYGWESRRIYPSSSIR